MTKVDYDILDEDKCGEHNLPCEDCGYYDCQESHKCEWSRYDGIMPVRGLKSGNENGKWTPRGPYGVCKPRGERLSHQSLVPRMELSITEGGGAQDPLPYFPFTKLSFNFNFNLFGS